MYEGISPRTPAFATVPGTDYASDHDLDQTRRRTTASARPGHHASTGAFASPVVPATFVPATFVPATFVPGGNLPGDDDPRYHGPRHEDPRNRAPLDHRSGDDDGGAFDVDLDPRSAPEDHASRRQGGWSAANQRRFLEALAEGHGVEVASRRVALSASSAYAFRRTAKGAAFALGWRAAALVARDAIAETLLVRALEGTVDTVVRGEVVITRHKYDNRLGLALLARLDRQAETAPDADAKAARLVAQEFDAYLDLVGQDQGAARAGLFLARRVGGLTAANDPATADAHDLAPIYALAAADRMVRTGVSTAGEVVVADLDPAARCDWSAEQWARAEAAGMVALALPPALLDGDGDGQGEGGRGYETPRSSQHSQHSPGSSTALEDDASAFGPGDDDAYADEYGEGGEFGEDDIEPDLAAPVWWCEHAQGWRTHFPPPADFDGEQERDYGGPDYERGLSTAEEAMMDTARGLSRATIETEEAAGRDRWFGRIAVRIAGWTALRDARAAEAAAAAAPAAAPAAAIVAACPIVDPIGEHRSGQAVDAA